jgi:hypothetical protein
MSDYLPLLTTRAKWQASHRNTQVGDTLLLIEKDLPWNKWLFGKVTVVYKGSGNFVRSVDVKVIVGKNKDGELVIATYNQPIVRCCLLDAVDKAPGIPPRV